MSLCTLLFLRKDDQILLAMKKRGFGAGRWNGVGGKVDQGETIEQAMVRECQEEIGVTPTTFEKVAHLDFVNDATDEPWTQDVHVYIATAWESQPTESEEMAPKWYGLHEIPYNEMWQDDQMWLPLVLRGQKVACRFDFDRHDNIIAGKLTVVDDFPSEA